MLHLGDSKEILKTLPENSVDAVVCDPPYGISFMSRGWDYDVPSVELWREVFRVMKPGAHLLSFGGTRTYHRMVVAIEDAGFEVRDQIGWCFGSGFPKSQNVSIAIDKQAGALKARGKAFQTAGAGDRKDIQGTSGAEAFQSHEPITTEAKKWRGFGTALKPAWEPIVLARKPLEPKLTVAANVLKHGTGALNIDASRIEASDQAALEKNWDRIQSMSAQEGRNAMNGGLNAIDLSDRKPTGGRWPANVLLDEEAAAALDEQSGDRGISKGGSRGGNRTQAFGMGAQDIPLGFGDSGGASRFFLVVKPDLFDITLPCGPENIKAADTSAGRLTENKSDSLSTDGFGSNVTAQYLLTTTSITKTKTHSITTFPISNAFTKTCIGIGTIVSEKTIDLSLAESVVAVSIVSDTEAYLSLRDGSQVHIKGTVSIALDESCKSGERQTENATTPITASTVSGPRFFYVAKASKSERNAGLEGMPERMGTQRMNASLERHEAGREPTPRAEQSKNQNFHPTVKPIRLMEYLVRMITPPGGTVLDCFMGSGSTGVAAKRLGFNFIGIERESEYFEIARKRIEYMELQNES